MPSRCLLLPLNLGFILALSVINFVFFTAVLSSCCHVAILIKFYILLHSVFMPGITRVSFESGGVLHFFYFFYFPVLK